MCLDTAAVIFGCSTDYTWNSFSPLSDVAETSASDEVDWTSEDGPVDESNETT